MRQDLIIKPTSGFSTLRLKEMWEYRELLYFLVWRDVKVRYKQTVIGLGWAVIRPILLTVVFTFIFNRLAGFSSDDIPYRLFALAGVLAWNFFSEGLTASSQSLTMSTNLISKVYFPRLIIPISAVLRGLVDFSIAFLVFVAFLIYYKFLPGPEIVFFPLVLCWSFTTVLGLGLWFAAIGVKYRDVAHALPFMVQIMFWLTPVGYSSSRIPSKLEVLYWLNPMTGVIEGFRYTLLGKGYLPTKLLIFSVFLSIVVLVGGVINFRRMEREFADVI